MDCQRPTAQAPASLPSCTIFSPFLSRQKQVKLGRRKTLYLRVTVEARVRRSPEGPGLPCRRRTRFLEPSVDHRQPILHRRGRPEGREGKAGTEDGPATTIDPQITPIYADCLLGTENREPATDLSPRRHRDPSAAFGRNQNRSSRQDAKGAKKTGRHRSYPWRSWRLCARRNPLSFQVLCHLAEKICAGKQDLNK